jgi:hypothetical protein
MAVAAEVNPACQIATLCRAEISNAFSAASSVGCDARELPDARKKSPGATNVLLDAKDSRDGRTPFSTGNGESSS